MPKELKADLSLLNKLVSELSAQLELAYKARDLINKSDPEDEKFQTFVVELSKSVGLLSGIANEASLLVGDLQKIMQYASKAPDADEPGNLLKSILSSAKTKGGMRN